MTNIHKLLNQIASAEAQLQATQFLAPCIKGGRVRTRVAGMLYTFTFKPRQFEGWGIFQPVNAQTATLLEEADLSQITAYLQQFPTIRLRLAYRLQHQSWLAYPGNEADMRQRFKAVKPVVVHLVTEGAAFEKILARWNGNSCWFEEVVREAFPKGNRRADPAIAETLQSNLRQLIPVEELQFKGMIPEMRSLYKLAAQQIEGFAQPQRDEKRLRQALKLGGGELRQFQDRGDYWTVDWTTSDGVRHTSAIAKDDLTVVSSGICLSGRDRGFDLQSLVGVMEHREW